jgi:WD40 repeat protein
MRVFYAIALVALLTEPLAAAFSFVPGDYYTSNPGTGSINQWDLQGNLIGSFFTGSNDVRGLAFGPDNLLYVSYGPGGAGFGLSVAAFDSNGTRQANYFTPSIYLGGHEQRGHLAVDGSYIYVSAADDLMRFQIGNPSSGTSIYHDNQVFDVKILPSGNLLVATAYEVKELTASGAVVRTIQPSFGFFTDIRSAEYDPATNNLFVFDLGNSSGGFNRFMRLDWLTGQLEKSISDLYVGDMYVTASGDLLAGGPWIYSQDLVLKASLGTRAQHVVTQYPVPEPRTLPLSAMALVAVCALARRSYPRLA